MTKPRLTKKTAKSLATSYAAYLEAFYKNDDNGVVCWGEMLRLAQTRTGVEMLKDATIDCIVKGARLRLAAGQKEAA